MTDSDFDQFFSQRTAAAEAYVNGDAAPLDNLVTKHGTATFHSPRGDTVSGADAVAHRYRDDAASFESGGTSRFEVLQKYVSGDLAFWAGFQVAQARLRGQDKPVDMRIRVSEAFRLSRGEWKLTHRHADIPTTR
jgi:ketosteroid isomerase-like protein